MACYRSVMVLMSSREDKLITFILQKILMKQIYTRQWKSLENEISMTRQQTLQSSFSWEVKKIMRKTFQISKRLLEKEMVINLIGW